MIIKKKTFKCFLLLLIVTAILFSCKKNNFQESSEAFQKAEKMLKNNPDSTIYFTQKELRHSSLKELRDIEKLQLYQLRLQAFIATKNIDSVMTNGHKLRIIASRIPDSLAIAQSVLSTIQANADYTVSKNLEKYLPQSIYFFKKRKMLSEMSSLNAFYGMYLSYKGEYEKAQRYFLDSYNSFKKLKKFNELAQVCNSIGSNYGYMGISKVSLKYYQEALSIAKETKDSLLLSNTYTNLGIHYRTVNPDSAIYNYQKSLSYYTKDSKSLSRIKTEYNLANVFGDTRNFPAAESVYKKMLIECEKQHFIEGIAMAHNGLASIYNQTNRSQKAIINMLNAVHIADSLKMTNLSLMLKPELISIYKKSGDYKNALIQAEQMKSLNDSILSKEKQIAVQELDIKYQTKEKGIENKHLSSVVAVRKKVIIILTISVILAVGLVLVYHQRSKLLKERNKAYLKLMQKYKREREAKNNENFEFIVPEKNTENKIEFSNLFDKLVVFYENEKPYLDTKLKADYVAKHLQVSPKELTTVIKANGYIGFVNFTNKFRVDEVIRQFEDVNSKILKMESIANQSGFGSRQSFYTAFEEFTGVNPGFYRSEMTK